MRKKLLALTIIISLCSFAGFAVETKEGLPGLIAAEFTTIPVKSVCVSESPDLDLRSDFYFVNGPMIEKLHVVMDHPKASGETEENYSSPRPVDPATNHPIPLDRVVLSGFGDIPEDGSSGLPGILESYIRNGRSAHFIVLADGTIIRWVDPKTRIGQMVVADKECNKHSLGVLVATDAEHRISSVQEKSIDAIIRYVNLYVNYRPRTDVDALADVHAPTDVLGKRIKGIHLTRIKYMLVLDGDTKEDITNMGEVITNVSALLGYDIVPPVPAE